MTAPGYQGVQQFHPNEAEHRRRLAEVVNNLLAGKLNATLEVTLRASQTTTDIVDARLGPESFLEIMPLTASAAAAKDGIYTSAQGKGTATLTHDSDTATDQTFRLLIIG